MPSVLFVCLGNICRSPLCEAVLKKLVRDKGLEVEFQIDSAGTSAYHIGETPDDRTVSVCLEHGVPVDHRARQVTTKDFATFDYIFCMDDSNLANLKRVMPRNSKAVLRRYGEFDPQGQTIIEDPYYGGINGFEINFQQAMRCSEAFLASIGY
ncbi:hypothetical protein AMAG_07584 [Allomyces macrogynus ATCC 38327]|uniref:Phosphotyrosine protein phosphatase I domain-containing protein n=1 Tax=Allomyces macrogynus (strain ATCC 38327) TaxID=578462 RepID=A0A0L0SIM3_ALLM3|nr:hypothetical protein AMAG_07584 [Allomyces macrogynus ATCC 38327]|eukprot:KNE62358.1 hypothetical protein AMAG_07584 [Allomyces macrogynus ATCC 38327]